MPETMPEIDELPPIVEEDELAYNHENVHKYMDTLRIKLKDGNEDIDALKRKLESCKDTSAEIEKIIENYENIYS